MFNQKEEKQFKYAIKKKKGAVEHFLYYRSSIVRKLKIKNSKRKLFPFSYFCKNECSCV